VAIFPDSRLPARTSASHEESPSVSPESIEEKPVAHSLSAKKRIRQGIKRNALNRHRKLLLKNDLKTLTTAITKVDAPAAADALKTVASRLGKLASKHTIHQNAAARRRGRLAKKVNALATAKAPVAETKRAPKAKSAKGAGTKA
jgi:small subunit ribosomal protein S20